MSKALYTTSVLVPVPHGVRRAALTPQTRLKTIVHQLTEAWVRGVDHNYSHNLSTYRRRYRLCFLSVKPTGSLAQVVGICTYLPFKSQNPLGFG